ncbi:hypothetical protein BDF14DRAFT_1801399 [Spinellus fusiger]|nr:hypothetical protein BDF14DRAFT_1801399 [Spinellus fusiger]
MHTAASMYGYFTQIIVTCIDHLEQISEMMMIAHIQCHEISVNDIILHLKNSVDCIEEGVLKLEEQEASFQSQKGKYQSCPLMYSTPSLSFTEPTLADNDLEICLKALRDLEESYKKLLTEKVLSTKSYQESSACSFLNAIDKYMSDQRDHH